MMNVMAGECADNEQANRQALLHCYLKVEIKQGLHFSRYLNGIMCNVKCQQVHLKKATIEDHVIIKIRRKPFRTGFLFFFSQ